jgi:hypothetical protein
MSPGIALLEKYISIAHIALRLPLIDISASKPLVIQFSHNYTFNYQRTLYILFPSPNPSNMKAVYIWLASLVALAAASPADPMNDIFKRDCNGGSCPCKGALGSQCFDSCDCQTACCNDSTRLCGHGVLDNTFCRGGEPGKL